MWGHQLLLLLMTLHALWHFNEKSPTPVRVRWEGGRFQASRQTHTTLHHPIDSLPTVQNSNDGSTHLNSRSLAETEKPPAPSQEGAGASSGAQRVGKEEPKRVSEGFPQPKGQEGRGENNGLLFGLGRLIFGEPVPLGFVADLEDLTPEQVSQQQVCSGARGFQLPKTESYRPPSKNARACCCCYFWGLFFFLLCSLICVCRCVFFSTTYFLY
jgi:hypothetical protein